MADANLTREDVTFLRMLASVSMMALEHRRTAAHLADRIERTLPPIEGGVSFLDARVEEPLRRQLLEGSWELGPYPEESIVKYNGPTAEKMAPGFPTTPAHDRG